MGESLSSKELEFKKVQFFKNQKKVQYTSTYVPVAKLDCEAALEKLVVNTVWCIIIDY